MNRLDIQPAACDQPRDDGVGIPHFACAELVAVPDCGGHELAPLVFSQPTLWFLRVLLPGKLAAIAGKPADYVLSAEDRRTLGTIFDSFFPVRPRAKGIIFDGYVGNLEIGDCDFERIRVPTLGVHAADDPLASYDDARAMLACIPGASWVHVERGGHIFIHNDEHARAEIAAFLTAQAASRSPELPEVREP